MSSRSERGPHSRARPAGSRRRADPDGRSAMAPQPRSAIPSPDRPDLQGDPAGRSRRTKRPSPGRQATCSHGWEMAASPVPPLAANPSSPAPRPDERSVHEPTVGTGRRSGSSAVEGISAAAPARARPVRAADPVARPGALEGPAVHRADTLPRLVAGPPIDLLRILFGSAIARVSYPFSATLRRLPAAGPARRCRPLRDGRFRRTGPRSSSPCPTETRRSPAGCRSREGRPARGRRYP